MRPIEMNAKTRLGAYLLGTGERPYLFAARVGVAKVIVYSLAKGQRVPVNFGMQSLEAIAAETGIPIGELAEEAQGISGNE
jgi:hypothetical protein